MVLRLGQHVRVLDSTYVHLNSAYGDCWSRAWGRAHRERTLQQFIRNWASFYIACEAYNVEKCAFQLKRGHLFYNSQCCMHSTMQPSSLHRIVRAISTENSSATQGTRVLHCIVRNETTPGH